MPKKLNLIVRHALIVLMLALFGLSANSQTKVNGKVTGPDAKPVYGASVSVKSTNIATSTGADGAFTITLPAGKKILVVSYIGYEVDEVNMSDFSNLSNVEIKMRLQATTLNEVVITGYTAQRKKERTNGCCFSYKDQ